MGKLHAGVIVVLLSGCNDPAAKSVDPPPCYDVPGEVCDETGETGGEDTDGETGSGGPKTLGPGECVFNNNQGKIGLQYDCYGELHTSLDLTITGLFPTCEALFDDDGWCTDDFYFGYGSNVVVCCGEYDFNLAPAYQAACILDLHQQLCFSLAARLEYLVQHGYFGAYTAKGAKLSEYVAARHDECFNAFRSNNVAELPHVETHWALQDDFGLLADVVLHIDANTRIDGVNAPDFEDDWPTCTGAMYNDDILFGNTDELPLGEIVAGVDLAAPVHAELSGPIVLGGAVSAKADLGPSCTAIGCSVAQFSYDQEGPAFGLEKLSLFGNSFEVSNGQYTLTADRVQINLYSRAQGAEILDDGDIAAGYEIPKGEATFLVSGASGDTTNWFTAVNATSIWVIPADDGGWEIDAFSLEYEDGDHERWTLMLEASQWR